MNVHFASNVKQCQMKPGEKSKANPVIQILSTYILYTLRSIVFFNHVTTENKQVLSSLNRANAKMS